ncbi:MAG: dihydroorotate dehydrogenase electron transfer subunit [bacterium]
MPKKKFVQDLKILRNTRLNERHFILELLVPGPLPEILPGQFVQVLVEDSPSTFLRRPFSVHAIDRDPGIIKLFIQAKGEGTRKLGKLMEGGSLNVIYPLGNSFSLPASDKVLLVGGGCGIAPLLFLAQYLHDHGIVPTILLGFRNKNEIAETEEYSKYGDLLIITDDGSAGEKGLITEHSIFQKEKIGFKHICCCGPDPMMKAVARIAAMHKVHCEASLENMMACGFGVCLCCVTPTDKGNERVCMEGPVFDTRRLKW